MKKQWFDSMVFKKELERRYGIKKSTDNRRGHDNSSYSNVDHLFGVKDIRNSTSDDPFLVRDSNGDSYSIYFDSEKKIFEIDNDHSFLSELKSSLYNPYMYATQSSWNNSITNRIDSYLQSQICIDTSSEGDSNLDSKDLESNDLESNDLESSDRKSKDRKSKDRKSNDSDSNDSDFDSNDFDFDFTDPNFDSNDFDFDFTDLDFDFTNPDPRDLDSSDSNLDSKDLDSNDLESNDLDSNDLESNDRDATPDYTKLWVQCEDCEELNYKRFLKSQMHMCEHCGYYFKMSSSERIEFLIDSGTWDPMDEDMVSMDPIGFDLEENPMDKDMDPMIFYPEENPMGEDIAEENPTDDEELRLFLKSIGVDWDWEQKEDIEFDLEDDEPYTDRLESYQTETGLTEAVQTGVGELNGIPVAIGVMDFEFIGGSMGSVVGEKITRLIEYATKQFLPLIIVCASGGARMQEGSLSLMQMAKISSALYDYQSNKKSFYVSILTSPTTGGVTASFGMLGNIIIAEPNAYIAFAGKRVIEETLKITVPEGSQEAELLFFEKGLFDLMVPRELLKGVLSELLNLHSFFPLNSNSIK